MCHNALFPIFDIFAAYGEKTDINVFNHEVRFLCFAEYAPDGEN